MVDLGTAERRFGKVRRLLPWAPLSPWLSLLGLFYLLPILSLVALSFLTASGLDVTLEFTWANYAAVFELATGRFGVILKTLGIGLVVVVACTLISVPVAYYLAKVVRSPLVQTVVLLLFATPFLVGPLVRTVSWRGVLGVNGLLNTTFQSIGLIDQPILALLYGTAPMVLAMTYNVFPFMLFAVFLTLKVIDDRYIQAARDLGASGWTAFWRVVVPLATPGLVTGAVLVFVPTLSAVLEPEMLGGPSSRLTPTAIRSQFFHGQNWPLGAALTVVFVVCALIAIGITGFVLGHVSRACGSLGLRVSVAPFSTAVSRADRR